MIYYLVMGVTWTAWLEWYTTRNLEGMLGRDWAIRERIFHCMLWPYSLGIFILEFIKQLLK